MRKTAYALAALAGAAMLVTPMVASASTSSASATSASATQILSFRGMNLTIPSSWGVYRDGDRVKVITGACGKPSAGYFTPKCDAFWLFGPKVIKYGHEGFSAYTPERPFYPASDVQRCPFNGKHGQVLGKATVAGLRQVGPGHKAHYRSWFGRCVKYGNGEQTATFDQREWFLPKSKILVVDVWNTPGLAGTLKRATWS
ncbi:hypothetical protein [Streptosporangium roseum]|uniref:Uncharacterized protein n=1 Tax=Streptosporangium roseum (strain ATCC 12428 / DSM 43021 / JCM 3005 / KCTC 9067 / NCIMB 10171 / NRRL 2505 / NI 9100) TaxID=479432 RepID=D2B7N4_STRRD|nr:hypothetical protein [Streptosporangium roseum]ACZ91555.1 hypothetical protein Sros_8923 [Streptosporangium roseum DSM 43021]